MIQKIKDTMKDVIDKYHDIYRKNGLHYLC